MRRLAIVLALLLATSIASAEPTAADRATARGLLDEGYALLAKSDAAGALKRFTAADALVGGLPSTKLSIARAQVALGQLVEAQDTLNAALRAPAPPDEPSALKKARADAAELLAQTTPRIPELTIVVEGASDPVVRVDGAVVPREALIAPRRLNPGHHTIEASTKTKTATANADLAEGERRGVTLDVAADAIEKPPPPPPPRAEVRREETASPTPWLLGGLGAAAAGAAVGTITGLMAMSHASNAEALGCVNDRCPPPAHADVDAAQDLAAVSTVGFIVAGTGAAVALVAWLLAR